MGARHGSSCEAVNVFRGEHRLNARSFKNFPAPSVWSDFNDCHLPRQAVRCVAWLGVAAALSCGSPVRYGASEPVPETCRAEARVIAWHEALIVHRESVVKRLGISDYRPCVPSCVQVLPHEVVLPNRFGTGQIEHAVQRLSEGHIGHDGGDVIRRNGLHQNRWKPNRLPFSRQLGDAARELEELRSTHDRVRNRGSLN